MGNNFQANGEGKLILELKWKGENCEYSREVKLTRLKPYQQVSLDLKIGDEKKVE